MKTMILALLLFTLPVSAHVTGTDHVHDVTNQQLIELSAPEAAENTETLRSDSK